MGRKNPASPLGSSLEQMEVEMLQKNPAFREEYVRQMLREDDPRMLILALRNVVEALGGISRLSRETGLNRTQLYRTLSKEGRPEYLTVNRILGFLGLHFTVEKNAKGGKSARLPA